MPNVEVAKIEEEIRHNIILLKIKKTDGTIVNVFGTRDETKIPESMHLKNKRFFKPIHTIFCYDLVRGHWIQFKASSVIDVNYGPFNINMFELHRKFKKTA